MFFVETLASRGPPGPDGQKDCRSTASNISRNGRVAPSSTRNWTFGSALTRWGRSRSPAFSRRLACQRLLARLFCGVTVFKYLQEQSHVAATPPALTRLTDFNARARRSCGLDAGFAHP